jgi:hypothetical protein
VELHHSNVFQCEVHALEYLSVTINTNEGEDERKERRISKGRIRERMRGGGRG